MTRTRPRRAVALAALLLGVVPVAAAADSSASAPVTVVVANGSRTLQVTGVDASLPTGPVALSFGPTQTDAPFGIVVTDVAHSRIGYNVSATMSDLYRFATSGVDCAGDVISSDAFSVAHPLAALSSTGVEALVAPTLAFVDSNLGSNLGALVGQSLTVNVAGLTDSVSTALGLMSVANGAGGAFTDQAAHALCGGGAATPTAVVVQTGATNSPDLSALAASIFDAAAGAGGVLTPAEAVSAGLLETGATSAGGSLYEATRSALAQRVAILGLNLSLLGTTLEALTTSVLGDLAGTADPVLDLVGQSGVYANLPMLSLDDAAVAGIDTGMYAGTMTVTLTDQ